MARYLDAGPMASGAKIKPGELAPSRRRPDMLQGFVTRC